MTSLTPVWWRQRECVSDLSSWLYVAQSIMSEVRRPTASSIVISWGLLLGTFSMSWIDFGASAVEGSVLVLAVAGSAAACSAAACFLSASTVANWMASSIAFCRADSASRTLDLRPRFSFWIFVCIEKAVNK